MKTFREEFDELLLNRKNSGFEQELEQIKQCLQNAPLILYGAGAIGYMFAHLLKQYNINTTCFCDKYKTGTHSQTGLPIKAPQALLNNYQNANIIISSSIYADEIMRELDVMGVAKNRIISNIFLNFHDMTTNSVEIHLDSYESAYNLFEDDISKQILLGILKCYLTPSQIISTPFEISSPILQYFDPQVITMTDNEIFCDGGMYVGDTAERFFCHTNNKFTHYYGFEPDSSNYAAACTNLAKIPNATLVPCGLWSSHTQLDFSGSHGSYSSLNEGGGADTSAVDVTALDFYFSDKVPPTTIKMDIEGAEYEALIGAERIITQYKPKLAICTYHKPSDIYKLPELAKGFRGDYKFYLRHYSNTLLETVFYAI